MQTRLLMKNFAILLLPFAATVLVQKCFLVFYYCQNNAEASFFVSFFEFLTNFNFIKEDLVAAPVFVMLMVIPSMFKVKIRITVSSLLLLALVLFIPSAFRFFQIYEIPFDMSQIKNVHGKAEILSSMGAELVAVVFIFIAILAILYLMWQIFFFKKYVTDCKQASIIFSASLVLSLSGLFIKPSADGIEINFVDQFEAGYSPLYRLTYYQLHKPKKKTRAFELEEYLKVKYNDLSLISKKVFRPVHFTRRRYNIVVYVLEGIGKNIIHLRQGDQYAMPNMLGLYKNAISFENHYSNSPLSVNALFTVLTGSYELPTDRWAVADYPRFGVKSLSELLQKYRYDTQFFYTGNLLYAKRLFFLQPRFNKVFESKTYKNHSYKPLNWGVDDRVYIEEIEKYLEQVKKRFFMMVVPVTPHHPYNIPDDARKVFKPRGGAYKQKSFVKYLNAVHYSDKVLGDVIKTIEKSKHARRTIILVYGDHGEAFGQHRRNYNHPFYLYEENLAVPFIIYNKHLIKKPRTYDQPSTHIDTGPTILDIVGLKKPVEYVGRSLLKSSPNRVQFFHTFWRDDLSGLKDGRYKYIYNFSKHEHELYDLGLDREEKKNLAKSEPEKTKQYFEMVKNQRAFKYSFYRKVTRRGVIDDENEFIAADKAFAKKLKGEETNEEK